MRPEIRMKVPTVSEYAAENHASSPGLCTPSPSAMIRTGAIAWPRPARAMNCAMTTAPTKRNSCRLLILSGSSGFGSAASSTAGVLAVGESSRSIRRPLTCSTATTARRRFPRLYFHARGKRRRKYVIRRPMYQGLLSHQVVRRGGGEDNQRSAEHPTRTRGSRFTKVY